MHRLIIFNAIRDEQFSNLILSEKLKTKDGVYFLRYGAARRTGAIFDAYRGIQSIAYIDRNEPLNIEQTKSLGRDVNLIYINIVGTLDNLAWCLRSEHGSESIKKLPGSRVGLFNKQFFSQPCFEPIRSAIEENLPWFRELSSRRDPSAHRIPLSIPPTSLNQEQLERYNQIDDDISKATRIENFDEVELLRKHQSTIGQFVPYFIHHPDEPIIPMFPTIPQDICKLIKTSFAVRSFLEARLT